MENIDKSDSMICNTKALMTFNHKKENDILFYNQMGNVQPTQLRDFDAEYELFTNTMNPRLYTCNPYVDARGGNAFQAPERTMCQGYQCYNSYHMQENLLVPCKENTFQNYVDCDNDKCCSVRHQLFMNVTKRR